MQRGRNGRRAWLLPEVVGEGSPLEGTLQHPRRSNRFRMRARAFLPLEGQSNPSAQKFWHLLCFPALNVTAWASN